MKKIGIFFGTDTGTTRLIAKKLMTRVGEEFCAKPLNVNRITADDFMAYQALIIGTPSYGEGALPSAELGVKNGSWEDFLPQLETLDMSGKTIAIYGLGNQVKYGDRFVSAMRHLYRFFKDRGATIVGDWSTEGYEFTGSDAIIDGRFLGLAVDNKNQAMLTEARLDQWAEQIREPLKQSAGISETEAA
ncbi:flavodoxin [Halioxenophilus sp. WMMB6]|uniref:flavodoxin n=1 Tax=Halioxenophilus sp. WMMB6 TaxID=3073815 RepID=UPI00295EAAA9|nr:flavodoxin [Halioxenophilus sp. WMMB6]